MIDKDTFLKPLIPTEIVDLPGLGKIRVRGLSRAEAVALSGVKDDAAKLEQKIILYGMAEPSLTVDEVARWYDAAPAGLIDIIVKAVERLSGLGEGAPKSGVPGVRKGS